MATISVEVAIVGGGPAGLAAAHAVLVARPGTRVAVLERSDLRPRGAWFGLCPNGVRAIEAISPPLRQALARHHTHHMKQRRLTPTGEIITATDQGDQAARILEHGPMISLPWHALQRELAQALPPGVLHTRHRFVRYDEGPDSVRAEFAIPEGAVQVEAALLVGCDGGQSQVREQMLGDGPPDYLGMAIWRAVRPIPADWVVDAGSVGWGGPGQPSLLTSTSKDGMMSWQAFAPWPANQLHVIGGGRRAYIGGEADPAELAAAARQSPEEAGAQRLARALAQFEGYPQPVRDLIATTDPTAVTEHGQFCREADKCQVYARGRIALTGDAAHLATPFLGQGCSQALEDALELGRSLGQYGPTPDSLAAYQQIRLPMASAVQRESVQLMRDFARGKMERHEYDVNIDSGFVQRTFEPLAAPGVVASGNA